MSDVEPAPAAGRREDGWDMRVVFVHQRGKWWWNAWRAATSTELHGFTDTPTAAWTAMTTAITDVQTPDQLRQRRTTRPASGAA